jgi:uncharacterized protein (DUF433 family)
MCLKTEPTAIYPSEAYIWTDPDRLGGTPCFKGTRVPIDSLFTNLENGLNLDEYLDCFPDFMREQAVAILRLAHLRTLRPAA